MQLISTLSIRASLTVRLAARHAHVAIAEPAQAARAGLHAPGVPAVAALQQIGHLAAILQQSASRLAGGMLRQDQH
jgi:hypothetical protein